MHCPHPHPAPSLLIWILEAKFVGKAFTQRPTAAKLFRKSINAEGAQPRLQHTAMKGHWNSPMERLWHIQAREILSAEVSSGTLCTASVY